MKYIRTKDGRIIDISHIELFPDLEKRELEEGTIGMLTGIPIIKQAKTIEELCDFVFATLDHKGEVVETDWASLLCNDWRIYLSEEIAEGWCVTFYIYVETELPDRRKTFTLKPVAYLDKNKEVQLL